MSPVVYVLTAWNERTGQDVLEVFSEKAAVDEARQRVEGKPEIYGAIYRRTVRN
jgi:hypothetical protein